MSDDREREAFGIDDPDTKAAMRGIRDWARRRMGIDLDWIPVESNIETDMRPDTLVDDRGMVTHVNTGAHITMNLKLIGLDRPGEATMVRERIDDSARVMVREMEGRLNEALAAQEKAEHELAQHQDEEAKLIRRVAAKTRLVHGPKHRELLLEFLEWFMGKTNTELDQAVWAETWLAAGVEPVPELTLEAIVDAFLDF